MYTDVEKKCLDYRSLLKERFGFDDFRPGQLESIEALMNEGALLSIQPTGFGKSLLYQFPSALLEGLTVVISPLLALVRDQVDHLNRRFDIPAAAINSDQSDEENGRAKQLASSGALKVLFVAPEQLDNVDRFTFLLHLPVSLVVVDEAHCISTWGHDFRPSYRQIVHYIRALQEKEPSLRVLGLTATANGRTEEDIRKQLSVVRPLRVLRESMDRPNIRLSVIHAADVAEKLEICSQLVAQQNGCGLIYCSTRDNVATVCDFLQEKKINAAAYHAGLHPEEKRRLQKEFTGGGYRVMSATNALGMGIDKQDLRYVIHFDIPGSITAYYQEVGRAGRDGLPARGILLYSEPDIRIQSHFIHSSLPTSKDFEAVLSAIEKADMAPNITNIRRLSGKHPTLVSVILAELVEQGFVNKVSRSGTQLYLPTEKKGAPHLLRYEAQKETKEGELRAMVNYSTQNKSCRMALLRQALGDKSRETCGHCSICKRCDLTVNRCKVSYTASAKWVENRPVAIAEAKLVKMSEGLSLLNGQMKSPFFLSFMRRRAMSSQEDIGLSDELLHTLLLQLEKLAAKRRIHAILPLPSRTWGARDAIAQIIASRLKLPLLSDILQWKHLPFARQGEMTNNDQRKHNVHTLMGCQNPAALTMGGVLLFDDYTGSGATLKEAARALRKEAFYRGEITPFTIAQVRWRLGASGMI